MVAVGKPKVKSQILAPSAPNNLVKVTQQNATPATNARNQVMASVNSVRHGTQVVRNHGNGRGGANSYNGSAAGLSTARPEMDNVVQGAQKRSWAASLPSLPQGVVDFFAGFGDAISLGTTSSFRAAVGIDGGVNIKSGYYTSGLRSGFAVSLTLSSGLGIASFTGKTLAVRKSSERAALWYTGWGAANSGVAAYRRGEFGSSSSNSAAVADWFNLIAAGLLSRFAPPVSGGITSVGINSGASVWSAAESRNYELGYGQER